MQEFLEGFGRPYDLVTGNHDLESVDFVSDEENLEAWKRSFDTEPCWVREVGSNTVLIGLSTTRFRDSPGSVHEVCAAPTLPPSRASRGVQDSTATRCVSGGGGGHRATHKTPCGGAHIPWGLQHVHVVHHLCTVTDYTRVHVYAHSVYALTPH